MPTLYQLKPAFQSLLRPLAAALARGGVTANQVTCAAVLLSLAGGLALWLSAGAAWALLLVPAVLFVRMAMNAIDGMLAREHGMASRSGALLNELGDAVSDIALYLPFAGLPGVTPGIVVLLVCGALVTELAGVLGAASGTGRRNDGPMGKSDRALVFGGFALALGLGVAPGPWTDWLLGGVLVLTALTVVNRVRGTLATGAAD